MCASARGDRVCKIKVLTPQSVRVQTEGDGEGSKGEDEESGLKRRKEIRRISGGASVGLFFLIFRGQFYSITVCPQSHRFCIIPNHGGEFNFSISKLI